MFTIRVLIIDDHATFLRALKRFLATMPEIEIVGEAYSGLHGMALVAELNPDIVLTDMAMPDMNGLDVIRYLKAHHPPVGRIVLTGHNTPQYRTASQEAGVHAFVIKSELNQTLPAAIEETLEQIKT